MKNLYIDFDGVILDTISYLYKDRRFNPNFRTEEERIKYFSEYPWESIITDDNILCDSINAINKIIASNKFNLTILTHINSLKEAILKINYLRKYFLDITIIPCPKQISKTKMVHTKEAILVDDYSGNLREWKKEGGIPVKFSLEKENDEFPTINNLEELINMF